MALRDLKRGDCDAPQVWRGEVLPEWIDCNGHMNVAWYTAVFDLAIDGLWQQFGINDALRESTGSSTFAVESHTRYLNEVVTDEHLVIHSRVLAWDQKRLHQIQYLFSADSDKLAATCEWLHLHVDLNARRVVPWPAGLLDQIAANPATRIDTDWPDGIGRVMGIDAPLGPVAATRRLGGGG